MQLNTFNSTAWLNSSALINQNTHDIKQLPEKFVNLLMKHGNKAKAYNILYDALQILYSKKIENLPSNNKSYETKFISQKIFKKLPVTASPPLGGKTFTAKNNMFSKKLLTVALNNIRPNVEVRTVKVAGKTYQVPAIIYKKRQQTLAIRWIIEAARKRKQNSNADMGECLALELFEALNKQGKVKQKTDIMHKLAESNRSYMRFKWWQ